MNLLLRDTNIKEKEMTTIIGVLCFIGLMVIALAELAKFLEKMLDKWQNNG